MFFTLCYKYVKQKLYKLKNKIMEDLTLKSELESNTIRFDLGKNEKEPIILLKDNGDIFVKGRLVENDKEVVEAMREFLKESGYIK